MVRAGGGLPFQAERPVDPLPRDCSFEYQRTQSRFGSGDDIVVHQHKYPLWLLGAVLFCGMIAPADASDPGSSHDVRVSDLEQRMIRLESCVSPEGCLSSPETGGSCTDSGPSIYAGYKFLFIKPQMKESFEATLINTAIGQTTLVPLDYSFNLTPSIWAGFRADETVGARVTYWEFDQNGNNQQFVSDGVILPGATATTVIYPAAIIAPAPGDILQTQNSLTVRTIDAEGTLDLNIRETELTLGGGLRFASTDQQMMATASRGGLPIGLLQWSREFEGFGPTVSATATHPLAGGLSAVGNFRGSLLYGEKDLNRTVIGDATPPAVATPPIVRLQNADEVVAAGDMGVGLRYTRNVTQRAQMFVQGTLEGQLWTEAGAPTLTFLGFQGLGLSLGFDY
jgi:hypothetical protein